MNTRPTKVLLLGNGYLGNHIKKMLDFLGYETKLLDSKTRNYHDSKTFWNEINFEFTPKYIINCSGFTGRPNIDEAESKKNQCWELNVTSPLRCAELANKVGIRYIHIGSGCIYTGYDKDYQENDNPNFGLFDDASSFYSKSKHAFEIMTEHLPIKIIRIRMPISKLKDARSYLSKIKNYDTLIDYKNSKTYIPDLCKFLDTLMTYSSVQWDKYDIYNVVNPEPLYTRDVVEIMKKHNADNPNWKFVDIDQIPIITGRSNCVLDNTKVANIYPLRTEREILEEVLNG